jgi:hypothetical protein
MESILLAPTDWSKVPEGVTEDQPRFAMDAKLHVQFYSRPIKLLAESEAEGRPIYHDVDHIRILVPGDKLNQIDRVASEDDIRRFAEHWAKYKAGKGNEVIGTRLEVVPWMTRAKVEEYKFFNIHTVEQLAAASDEVGQKFPGFQTDKQKAQKFLEATHGTDARVKKLEDTIAELLAEKATRDAAVQTLTSTPAKK